MANRMRTFQSPGFPHNFSQNYPHNSNMGCIDASRRQLQSVIKIRVHNIFLRKHGYLTLHTKGSELLPYAFTSLWEHLDSECRGNIFPPKIIQ
jgi:hypothetical protein